MNPLVSPFAGAVSFPPFSRGNFNTDPTCYTHIVGRSGLSKIYVPSKKLATLYRSSRLKNYDSGAQKSCSLKCYKLLEEGLLGVKLFAHQPWHFLNQQLHNRQKNQITRASFDNEFRSSQSIALGLHRRYKSVVEGGFTGNLQEFIDAGVTAYAVGCTDEGLRKELLNIGTSAGDVEGTMLSSSFVGLKSKLTAEEVEECILWTSIIFITILCTPQPTVMRWSSTPAVSAEAQVQWRGFCALIANAYYVRGMAWLPVKTLQLEQIAVTGHAEETALVADRMRLVFATLEVVSPQWPKQ